MDAYLNKVPACQACNKEKGTRTILVARMPIHPEAYRAYEGYLEERKRKLPAHYLMNAKKGLLNLLKGVNGGFWGERPESNFPGSFEEGRLVRMLGRDLVSQARTQSSARMLARYLATKLEDLMGKRPGVESFNARYVAHIRNRLCPDFSKSIEKRHGHALDAAILSCRWPHPNIPTKSSHDGRWEFNINWNEEVRKVWPANIKGDGAIELPEISPIQGFEERLEKGGFFVNLSSTNWNQREISVADQTIYRIKGDKPTVRKPARDWLDGLKKKDPVEHIEAIVHPHLKRLLLDTFKKTTSTEEAGRVFKEWFRATIKAGLKGPHPAHPSSQARWEELRGFVEGGEDIPPTVSLQLVQEKGIEASPDIMRLDKDGKVVNAQRAQPSYRYFLVAYKRPNPDKRNPLVLGVKQSWRVEIVYGQDKGRAENVKKDKPCLRGGRAYRNREREEEFLKRWGQEMAELLDALGYERSHKISQGNIILYGDGHHSQLKNFKKGESVSKETFRDIRHVYTSPYSFLLKNTP